MREKRPVWCAHAFGVRGCLMIIVSGRIDGIIYSVYLVLIRTSSRRSYSTAGKELRCAEIALRGKKPNLRTRRSVVERARVDSSLIRDLDKVRIKNNQQKLTRNFIACVCGCCLDGVGIFFV